MLPTGAGGIADELTGSGKPQSPANGTPTESSTSGTLREKQPVAEKKNASAKETGAPAAKQETEVILESFPWERIGSFNEGKKFDRAYLADANTIKDFVTETFRGDWYWNTVIIIGVCFFSWLISRWRFGIFGLIFVLLSASSVYRAEYRRFQRNVRDDIQRANAVERLEKNFESIEWLNNFLVKFWVIYMPALSETVMVITNDVLKDLAPGYGIDSLTLDEFTLGTKAPRIDSIKSYTKKGKDIIEWDWAFRFTPNDTSDMTKNEIDRKQDPKVALGVRVGKAMISKRLPILVENMSVSGRAKITLQLSLNFPHIKLVSVSLLEPPKIDFSLKPVGGDTFGLDIMSLIPGLSTLINTLINSNVGPMLYAPNKLDVDVEELMAAQSNDATGVVAITVKSAAQLKDSINPYVQISTDKNIEKPTRTGVMTKTRDASWNETKYVLVSSLEQKLHLDVYNFSVEKKKGILYGSHEFELDGLLQKESQVGLTKNLEMAGKKKGLINYDIRWFPVLTSDRSSVDDDSKEIDVPDSDVGVFKIVVHQVRKLDATETVTGHLNPMAELYIDGKMVKKYRTLKNSNEPSWEESAEFLISQKNNCKVELKVKDTGSRNGITIDSLTIDLDALVFDVSDGNDVFTMDNGATVRITAIWKPISLTGTAGASNYVQPIGVARLHIRKASDLLNLETVGEVDPYCRVLLNNRLKYETAFHPDTCNPPFGDVVYTPITSTSQHISLELMDDQKMTRDRPLGYTNIMISEVAKRDSSGNYLFHDGDNEILSSKLQLPRKIPKGTIFYSLSFIPMIPTYTTDELEELKEREAAAVSRNKERAEQMSEWEALYKKSPALYEWIDIEDKEAMEVAKKEKMTLDQLLTYRSGTLGFRIIGGTVKKNESVMQICLDDIGPPSFVSTKASGRHVNAETGDAFVRDLPNSLIAFRNTKKAQVKDSDDILAETTLKTIDVLQKGFYKPYTISFDGVVYKIQFIYTPSAIKLPPSETILDTGKATIEIVDAEGLLSHDRNGKSDPFVSIKIGSSELFKTKVCRKTLTPTWNESTIIPFISRSRTLMMLYVKDWDRTGSNDVIGQTRLDISSVPAQSSELITLKLEPQGSVRLKVTFAPEYMRPKVGSKEFGQGYQYLTSVPLQGLNSAANMAAGIAGTGGAMVVGGVGMAAGSAGMLADMTTGTAGNVTKGGSSLIKSVLGKKSKKSSDGHSSRRSMEGSIQSDSRSINSRITGDTSPTAATGSSGGATAAGEKQHQRTSSQISTFTQAMKGKSSTQGQLIINSGTSIGKEAQLRVSLAVNGKLKELYTTKTVKARNNVIVWDDEVEFDAPRDAEMVFGGVVHKTFGKDTELGTASVRMYDVIDSPREIELDLGQGKIVVSFRYSPEVNSDEPTPPPAGW